MPRFYGKRVLITGGTGAVGCALAAGFRAEGGAVTVLDQPGGAAPAGMTRIGADLRDLPAAEAMVTEAGPFDILIDNAAPNLNRRFEDVWVEEYEEQIKVNSYAAFRLVQACEPGMKAKGCGRVISMTSVTLNGQREAFMPDVASTGGMVSLTKALARELGEHGVAVNAIAPGAVRSKNENRVLARTLEEHQGWFLKNQCLKTRIEAEDAADLAMFLALDAARMITGQNIHVDGGW